MNCDVNREQENVHALSVRHAMSVVWSADPPASGRSGARRYPRHGPARKTLCKERMFEDMDGGNSGVERRYDIKQLNQCEVLETVVDGGEQPCA